MQLVRAKLIAQKCDMFEQEKKSHSKAPPFKERIYYVLTWELSNEKLAGPSSSSSCWKMLEEENGFWQAPLTFTLISDRSSKATPEDPTLATCLLLWSDRDFQEEVPELGGVAVAGWADGVFAALMRIHASDWEFSVFSEDKA